MSQANSPTSGDRNQAGGALLTCPYRSCGQQMRYPDKLVKTNYIQCEICQGPIFLDYCPLCKSWNAIPVRVAESHDCKNRNCKNRLSVTKQVCPLCKKGASLLTSAATPSDFFCSECHKTGKIGSSHSPLDLDEENLLASAGGDTRRVPPVSTQPKSPSAVGSPPVSRAPATTGPATFVGNKSAPSGDLDDKLDQLIRGVKAVKAALDFYPTKELPENLSNSRLAALFEKLETAILGPKTKGKNKDGEPVKSRKWNHLPAAILKLLGEHQKKLSEEEDEESPKEGGRPLLWGIGGRRQNAKEASNDSNATALPGDLTVALDALKMLGLQMLKKLPDLLDAIDTCLQEELDHHQNDAAMAVVEAVKRQVDNWLGIVGLIKEVPDGTQTFDSQRYDRDDDRPTNDADKDGKIHSVLQPGYLFDDGEKKVVLRRPRVLVWYLE